jgi:hypothetical protein
MGAIKEMWIEAQDAISNLESPTGERSAKLWNDWKTKYADQNGKTPMGYVDDVYDVFTDFTSLANNAGLDPMATQTLLSMATGMLAEGKDPYEIQEMIDQETAVYVAESGHIVIGKIVLTGN